MDSRIEIAAVNGFSIQLYINSSSLCLSNVGLGASCPPKKVSCEIFHLNLRVYNSWCSLFNWQTFDDCVVPDAELEMEWTQMGRNQTILNSPSYYLKNNNIIINTPIYLKDYI